MSSAAAAISNVVGPSTTHRWLAVVSHLDPRYGGLSAVVPQLGLSLANTGHMVSLAAFTAPGEQYRPAGYDDAGLSFWPSSRISWLQSAPLREQFRELVHAAEGLHIHGLWETSTAVACRAARKAGRPYILSAHGMLEPWALQSKGLKKNLYAALLERTNVDQATCLHALTGAEAQQYRSFGASGPIAVIPNAVEVPPSLSPENFLNAFPKLRGKRLILFLGRLHPKKGLNLLAEAWLRVCREYPDAVLVLAGPDSEGTRAKVEPQLHSPGQEQNVVFTGMLDAGLKWSALAAAECFVLPSFSEGLSVGVLEALGAGLPVVVTRACNMPEVTRFHAGCEIEPDTDELTAALRDVLQRTPEENRAIGLNGAKLVQSRHHPRRIAAETAAMYDFALTGTSAACLDMQYGGER